MLAKLGRGDTFRSQNGAKMGIGGGLGGLEEPGWGRRGPEADFHRNLDRFGSLLGANLGVFWA